MSKILLAYVLALTSVTNLAAPALERTPFKVPAKVPDLVELPSPSAVHLRGFLGARLEANARHRLLQVDEEPLLAGFRQKPGSHPWIGEHVGKWMHAATLAWAYTGDADLRAKLDRVAAELIRTQEADGYLGTYVPEKRFGLFQGADWDVWSHKYCLMGLLTYHQFTGHAPALEACRKAADLLVRTFGPGKKSILAAGTHVGMAATSVLEPIVLLYRFTGDPRYLDFGEYLVSAWEEPNGPKVLTSLLTAKNVSKTANGKAYEMLSNLVGLCELARVTGRQDYLQAAVHAWEDVVARRLYLTGSASQGEHFRDAFHLPNAESAHVAETCVTTTWIQLNSQLLRLTGEARYGDELERTLCNHLAAAQRPDGRQWCYFTSLEGRKPYGPGINCCVSSGPRGMALVPQHAVFTYRDGTGDGLALNLFDTDRATLTLGGVPVRVEIDSAFPLEGRATLTFRLEQRARFAFKVRAPDWAGLVRLRANGRVVFAPRKNGYVEIPSRPWSDGDQIELTYAIGPRLIEGTHGNTGKAAVAWGPFVLAYESQLNPGQPPSPALALEQPVGQPLALPDSEGAFRFRVLVRSAKQPKAARVQFLPFADAGRGGGTFRVWLRAPGSDLAENLSLLSEGVESRSRPGNLEGSINDGESGTFVVTFDGQPAAEDWFAVTCAAPQTVRRILFAHGSTFHDGGWFDASKGKPKVQVQREPQAAWTTVGELADYPATTATDPKGLTPGQPFTLLLPEAVAVVAVRVLGQPACGDHPAQAFSSCGELQAWPQ